MIAAHLLAAPPAADPWVADALRAAARSARGQGAPELAAAYLRRALLEPPADRVPILLELGRAEHAAGAPEATARLEEAWRASGAAELALELTSMLAERARWRDAVDVAREALGDEEMSRQAHHFFIAAADREVALHLFALLGDSVRMDPTIEGDEPARLQVLAETLAGDTPGERHVLAAAAVVTPVDTAQEHARAAELAQHTQADVDRFADTGVVSSFIRASRLDQAQEAAEAALETARRGGFIQRHASMLSLRGWIWLERGALAEARDDLEGVLAFAPDVSLPPHVTKVGAALLAVVLAEQGELAHADATLERHDLVAELPEHQVMNLVLHFRSRVRALQGRADEAREDALAVGRRYARLDIVRAVPPWRSQAAVLTGDEVLAREEVALAERWGTPLARGLALRGLGLVTGDERTLRDAVAELEASPNRLELARAQVELGAALRRAGRRAAARDPLRDGHGRRLRLRRQAARGARPHGAAGDRRATEKARAPGQRRADAERAARREPRGRRAHQPADRAGVVRHHGDGRDAPASRLPQARRGQPRRAGGGARGARSRVGAQCAPGVTSPARGVSGSPAAKFRVPL